MTLDYLGRADAGTISRPAGAGCGFRHKMPPVLTRRFCLLDFRTPVRSNLWRDGSSKEASPMDSDPRAEACPYALNSVQRDQVWIAAHDAAQYVMRLADAEAEAYADAVICMLIECGEA